MIRRQPDFPAEQTNAISTLLREPRGRTRSLLAANREGLAALEHRRNSRLAETALRRHAARLHFPQARNLRELLGDDPRPRLLTSYHFGDYIYGLNLLGATVNTRARAICLSRAPGSAAYFANMKLAFGETVMGPEARISSQKASSAGLAPLLRHPGIQIITFCDLAEPFGGRTEVDFLFRKAWFSRGPALLGLTNRIPLLPVINWFDGNRGQVVLGAQIEPERFSGETLAQATGRITAELVRFFEPFFRLNPEQWRHLGALPFYFFQAGGAGALQSKEKTHASTRQDLATARSPHQ